jgi:hypothetical protein
MQQIKHMKFIFKCLCVVFLCTKANAQLKLGIKGSPQITFTSSDSKIITAGNSKVNISYGLVLDYFFSENYAIGTEFSVGMFSGSISIDSVFLRKPNVSSKDMTYDYQLQYINTPILIKMRTKEIGYLRYYGEFGFGISYNFRAKADIHSPSKNIHLSNVDVNNPDAVDDLNPNYSQKVNFFRTSLIIGAGVQYNVFGNTLLTAGLRYDNALNQFTDESNWKSRMNFLALHLGVMF